MARYVARYRLHPARRTGAYILCAVLVFSPTYAPMAGSPQTPAPAPAPANKIIPTGQTATHVTVSGAVTDITTTTMSGGNAFNAFSQFSTVAGSTVDLIVPPAANELVNIVENAPVVVNGIKLHK